MIASTESFKIRYYTDLSDGFELSYGNRNIQMLTINVFTKFVIFCFNEFLIQFSQQVLEVFEVVEFIFWVDGIMESLWDV